MGIFLSCSLQYDQTTYAEGYIPELMFNNAEYTRYENYERKVQLKAEKLEQYKDTGAAYGQTVSFCAWNNNELDTEGNCHYLSINTKDQIYTLFTDILIKNYGQDMEIQAQNLKWNNNTEQLTAGTGETVSIRHEGLILEGSGFAASGITKSYSFDYDVEGVYDDSPQSEDSDETLDPAEPEAAE